MQQQFMGITQQVLNFNIGNISVGSILQGLILFIVMNWIIRRMLVPVIDRLLGKCSLEGTIKTFLGSVAKVLLNFVGLCVIVESIGIPVTSVLTVLGMLGLAISLSVQGALSNVANGLMILVTGPFKVGQYINAAGVEGTVKEVSLLCTKLVTVDNKEIIIPNSEVMGGKITNFSSEKLRRVDIDTKAAYGYDDAKVKNVLMNAIASVKGIDSSKEAFVRVSGYTDYSVIYTVRVWCDSAKYWDVYFDLIEAIGREKTQAGISGGVPSTRVMMGNVMNG